ncbi:serine hydrolase domain-containing protein [uncultured Zobellia sp.]|uniref:serine hydrolase domain-containing protein n=1 Tax=uncultured Zobellia sp. TaxID=255433 RepID=UPI0025945AEA|nr:serine hydrolase domain-containing protein [uncultured Zobellia sp.]
MKIGLLILAFNCLNLFLLNGQDKDEPYTDLIANVDSIISKSEFNGVVSISSGLVNIYTKAIGYSDLEERIPMELKNQFVIGSIGKQITAVLILREFEKGNLNLDDKINKYLESVEQPWSEKVTIHHLLTHTHGISDVEKPLEFKEGSQFKYSQLGYELLARILQKITGNTFEENSSNLFLEYGFDYTFHPKNKEYDFLVKGYEEDEKGTMNFSTDSFDNYVAAGGFISNAIDLKKWNELLYSGQLVTKQTLKLMSTRYASRVHPIFGTIEYGYGLLFKDGNENIEIGALGYAPGFVSACCFYPSTKINVIILENTARHLDDFKQTFKVHTGIMDVVKEHTLQSVYSK